MPPSAAPTPRQSHQRRLWRRWVLRVVTILAVLFILILVVGQIIFLTDLPRNLVVDALQTRLGLRISVKSLSTGWFGHTTLHDVAFTLPLADRAFLSVPTLQLEHSSLARLIFTGSFSVQQISIENPQLEVIQDPSGIWNVGEAARVLKSAGGAQNASHDSKGKSDGGIPKLPRIFVHDATVIVTDSRGRCSTISNLSLSGRSDGPLVWECRAAVPNQLDLAGKVAVGGDWNHQITLTVQDIGSWMSPWIQDWPGAAHLSAHWSGEVADGGVRGRLDLDDASFGSRRISGPVEVTIQGERATLRPAGVLVTDSNWPALGARADDGQILLDAAQIESKDLSVAFASGRASLDGKFDLADDAAHVQVAWRDVELPASVRQSGELSVDYARSPGVPRFKAALASHGAYKTFSWDGQFDLDGQGKSLQSLSLTLAARKLRLDNGNQKLADLSGLVAKLNPTGQGLALTAFHLGETNPSSGYGEYTFATRTGWLFLDARGWPIPHAGTDTLNLDLNLWCDPSRVHIQQLYVGSGALSAYGNGDYVYRLPKPVSAHVYFNESPQGATPLNPSPSFRGNLTGKLDLSGNLNPANLTVAGMVWGSDVYIGRRPFGDLSFALEGALRDGQVSLFSGNIEFLGGNWYVSGHWPVKDSLLRLDAVRVRHLSLPLALARDDVSGEVDGNCWIDVRQLSADGVFAEGSAMVSNLAIGGAGANSSAAILAADQIQIPSIHVADGRIEIKPITLRRKTAHISARATGEVSTTVARPTELSVKLDASDWPLHAANADALCLLGARGKLDVDVKHHSAVGHVDVRADTSWGSQPIGRFDAALDFNRRRIHAAKIQVHGLGGSAAGYADVDLDHPYQTHAKLDWNDVDLSRLPKRLVTSSLTGKIKGSLGVQPATTPRPLQPLAIVLQVIPENVQLDHVSLGELQTFAYVGPDRLVLDADPSRRSQLAFAGGTIEFWGRVSRHSGDLYQSLLQIDLQNLDLDSVLPSGSKIARTPGLLGGRIAILGRLEAPDLAYGEGHLVLSQSDLAGTGPIAILYNLMHFGHSAAKPRGYGTIDFQIQQRNISLTALRYFDRGAEVHAAGLISDVSKLSSSPIDFTIVGSARPLGSIDLPGVSDIDEALNAIQQGAITVHVSGDFNKPITKRVLFSDVGREMQNLLVGGTHQDDEAPE